MKKTTILLLLLSTMSVNANKRNEIKIKTVYKRSKKIWGVYTLKKQDWFQGKSKHRVGAKEDHVLLRKKGKLVFIGPEFKDGLISYDVKSVPYIDKGNKKIEVSKDELVHLDKASTFFNSTDSKYETTSFKCSNKWSKIECTQTIVPINRVEVALEN